MKARTWPATHLDAIGYWDLAFRDYIGSRCLLLNNLHMQGATLASTSLEKYLKCLLALSGLRTNAHLDNLQQFKKVFSDNRVLIIAEFDATFMDVLSKAYVLRYYDTTPRASFGFFTWQLLGELDSTVHLIESRLTLRNADGKKIPSPYFSAFNKNDPLVCKENYLAGNVRKKDFMERPGPAFILSVDSTRNPVEVIATEGMAVADYQGRMQTITDVKIT